MLNFEAVALGNAGKIVPMAISRPFSVAAPVRNAA